MEEVNPAFRLEEECMMLKLDEDVLFHCQPFSCGEEDLDQFFAQDGIPSDQELRTRMYYFDLL